MSIYCYDMYIPVFETSCFLKNQIKGARQNVSYHPRWICQEWRATFLIKLQKLECFWDWKRRVWKRIRKIRKFQSVWKSQEKVSFNIASEASYVYKSSSKNAKNSQFWQVFFLKNWNLRSKSVTRQVNVKISKFK